MKIRTLIVDDEPAIIELLKNMLSEDCPQVTVVATASNTSQARRVVNSRPIDLVLLDVKLGSNNGFNFLRSLEFIDFQVIFITAFNEYAVEAFRFSALDFLLKPIDPDQLIESIKKVERVLYKDSLQFRINHLLNNTTKNNHDKTIVLKTAEALHIVKIRDIIECEAQGNYTIFHFSESPNIITSQTLKKYDLILSDYGFFRCHQSHLVNISCISRYDKRQGGALIMCNDVSIPVSPKRKEQLFHLLDDLS